MNTRFCWAAALAAAAVTGATASADLVGAIGGQTNVALDFDILSAAAGLEYSSVSAGTIGPDGDGEVGFVISPPLSSVGSSFAYDSGDFANTFSGIIEHRGAVFFNKNSIAVGNFGIGFDDGWYVQSNFGLKGRIFDVEITSADPTASSFAATGNLLVSAFFADLLLGAGLAGSDLTGANVGTASIQAYMSSSAVPAPGAVALLGMGGLLARRRRG
ncbi:MAG: hypothetical protein VYB77_01045 [Planctomycetota bacterium]|nr:hypothetical protein [Planctomycetota bacterium]MEC9156696.1 hypothetical protein [Planctomycetota bacterium]